MSGDEKENMLIAIFLNAGLVVLVPEGSLRGCQISGAFTTNCGVPAKLADKKDPCSE